MDVRHLDSLDDSAQSALFNRDADFTQIRDQVTEIITAVRSNGDQALREFSKQYDEVSVDSFDITDSLRTAAAEIPRQTNAAIETAADNIRSFHRRQLPADWRDSHDGRELGRRFHPITHVGVYVPGGTAAYPSSALMGVIPAVVAGVDEITVVTPPADEINPVTLAALEIAGATSVYSVGGAQAIAALAYGTESIPAVKKIVGPGNIWVTAAKQLVQGDVAIDFLAGPSELLILADDTANSSYIAADMIAQAEHDPNAACVTVTTSESLATSVVEQIETQLETTTRRSVSETALTNKTSGVFIAADPAELTEFAESFAPEHLSIQTTDPETILTEIQSAGSVFLGPYTPVAAGDYASGTNHILPTGGRAKTTGGLSVDTFLRATTIQSLDRTALGELQETITTLARAEGLDAHATSVDIRFDHSE